MNCSENTVKSRLNYGRKNLRIRAEQLQKKGYKLYGIAPLPLLLYLFRTDAKAMSVEGAFTQAGQQMASHIFSRFPLQAGAGGAGVPGRTVPEKTSVGKTSAGKASVGKAAGKVSAKRAATVR